MPLYFLLVLELLIIHTQFNIPGKSSGLSTFGLMWCNGKIRIVNENIVDLQIHLQQNWTPYGNLLYCCRNNMRSILAVLDINQRWTRTDNDLPSFILPWISGLSYSCMTMIVILLVFLSLARHFCKTFLLLAFRPNCSSLQFVPISSSMLLCQHIDE